jgi:transposase
VQWEAASRIVRKYEREGQRYASDLTDAEWALIEPHMPAAKRLGRPRATELRTVLDAILYIALPLQLRIRRGHNPFCFQRSPVSDSGGCLVTQTPAH